MRAQRFLAPLQSVDLAYYVYRRSPCAATPSHFRSTLRVELAIKEPEELSYLIGRFWLWLFGWKIRGETPTYRKFVFIAAPHTSNWDFPFMLATAYAMRVRISWFGKHTLFIPPWGWLMRRLGGIPVDRRAPQTLVMQMVDKFRQSEDLVLAVPPEGTRSKVDVWKSGFYHIASESGVPVGLGYLDYQRRLCGLGMFVVPSGNIPEDMNRIRSFYRDIRGKHPELESEPRLREETD
jgi:1-acyl-sn-glycerol-3-phosphate acyltransferase